MRKTATLILLLLMVTLAAGCGSKVPEAIRNPNTHFTEIKTYGDGDFTVPENYRHLRDNIYAVLDEAGTVTGYRKVVFQSGKYVWVFCEPSEVRE